MSSRQQNVRSFQPPSGERFDQQFWPIFMASCITATILAATVVSLLTGFWMWVSLMVLPAAIAILLAVLRFVDDKRIRRSMQLAVILSLAVHCIFLIVANETSVFKGFFLQVNRVTTPVKQQRVINVSKQVETLPWMDDNPVPSPTPDEPTPEKQSQVDTATARPQPSPVQSQKPTENPQLVRRQQLSRTVPRLGKSLSKMSRQTDNAQPKSSEKISLAKPAPRNEKSQSSELQASTTEIARRPKTSEAPAASKAEPTPRKPAESAMARDERRDTKPEIRPSEPKMSRRETAQPKVAEAAPKKNVQAPRAAEMPTTTQSSSNPSDTANLTRRARNSSEATAERIQRRQPVASSTSQLAQPTPKRNSERPSVAKRTPTTNPSRTAVAARAPASPENIERPRPVNQAAMKQGSAELSPQPVAIEKSVGGTAGVGQTKNFDREVGSRQSAASTPSDSMRRPEMTTERPNRTSMSLRQMARVPRTSAAEAMPSSPHRPESIPIATRSANATPSELSASSSASLTQSNADARRSETSVEKGTGNVDLGPTRIVGESIERRVEGGGRPEIQNQPVARQMARKGDQGAASPNIASTQIERVASDSGSSNADNQASNEPTPAAEADMNLRRDGQTAESGAPLRSDDPSDDIANTSATEMADASLGRADQASDEDEDDEEERRRRAERAQQLARSSRRSAGNDSPTVDSEMDIERVAQGAGSDTTPAASAEISEMATDLSRTSSPNANRGGATRGTSDAEPSTAASTAATESTENDRAVAGKAGADRPGISEGPPTSTRKSQSGETSLAVGDTPEVIGRSQTGTGLANQVTDDNSVAELDRNSPPGIALDIEAKPGPAGVSNVMNDDPGVDSRRASRDSPAIQSMTETRFRKEDVGGAPAVSSAPVIAREAFRSRNQPSRSSSAPTTEEAIELGLAFLARNQQEDGSWTLSGYGASDNDRAKQLSSDTAATGLAILAFQGAGYNHKEFKYAGQLQAAVDWMVEHQRDTGELYISADESSNASARLYSHGIASLAIAEAYGMTQDDDLRQPVQLALDFIADAQNRNLGGWRYQPGAKSDTSVTGWMMMALQSGKLAGLETDEKTWLGIERWLRYARSDSQQHLFRYDPNALDTPEKRHGRQPSPCMTAVGLLMNVYLGWNREDPRLEDGAQYLLQHLPDDSSITKRDTYYWYYATQILRHVGGESWEKWNAALHPLLVGTQIKDGDMAGSWDPLNPVPDRWGAHAGRLYVTTMNLLSLEVDYRLLPLHDDTVK